MELMLDLGPHKRITAEAALEHPFVSEFHDPMEEPVASSIFDWSLLERDLNVEEWRELIFEEIDSFYRSHSQVPREILVSPFSES